MAVGRPRLLAGPGSGSRSLRQHGRCVNRHLEYLSFLAGWRQLIFASAAAVIVQGALLVWLSFWLTAFFFNAYAIKLIAIVAIGGAMAVFYAVYCLFKRPTRDTGIDGETLAQSEAPVLWAYIRDMAARSGTAPPQQIVAGIDTNFFVTEAPLATADKTLQGRTLFISLPLLRVLGRAEADAVLAHELAHFSGGDTAYSAALGPKLVQYDQYSAMMHAGGVTRFAYYLLRLYRVIFEFAHKRDSREREFVADRMAAKLVSARAIVTALIKDNGFGGDVLKITDPEKGWLGTKTTSVKLPGISKEREKLKAVLGAYWQRHQVMRLVYPPLQLRLLHDGRGKFFDRLAGGVQKGNVFAAHQGFGVAHFLFAVFQVGIAAVGAALAAYALQARGADGEAVEFAAQPGERLRQAVAGKVFGYKWIIGGAHPELHRQVQAGGRLAAARYTDQDHVGFAQVARGHTVVVRQRIVDRLHALIVIDDVVQIVRAPDLVRGARAQFVLQRHDEDLKAVEK